MNPDAVKAVVDRAPELSDDQRAKIRAILLPALPGVEADVHTEDSGAPGHGVRGAVTIPPLPRRREVGPHATE